MPLKFILKNLVIVLSVGNVGCLTQAFLLGIKSDTLPIFSHGNILENQYFANEMNQALMNYRGFQGDSVFEENNVAVDEGEPFFKLLESVTLLSESETYATHRVQNLTDKEIETAPWKMSLPTINRLTLKQENIIGFDKAYIINYLGQKIAINLTNAFDQTFFTGSTIEQPSQILPSKYELVTTVIVKKIVTYRKYAFYIPIKNDEVCKKVIDTNNKTFSLTPRELVNFVNNDLTSLDYYLGPKEFYQYKDIVGLPDSNNLVWAITQFDNLEIAIDGGLIRTTLQPISN